jgi:propionyl-CoA synthetase
MLACARIGAVHSVVFGGFAAKELATRIVDAGPKLIVSATCGIEGKRVIPYLPLLTEALEIAGARDLPCIVVSREQLPLEDPQEHTVTWEEAMAHAEPVPCVPVAATDPLYILYTSGTTGQPKGVVRPNGGHAVALKWSMEHIYDVKPGDVYWAASDIGWVVGHSYIVYAPLLHGCTTILYEGKPGSTACSRRQRRSGPFAAPIQKVIFWPVTTRAAWRRCSWPVNAATRIRCSGLRKSLKFLS